MKEKSKIIEYLLNKKNPYTIKTDNMDIEMIYSKSNKTFEECMLNILKRKKGGKKDNGRKKIKVFF
ncbi:MAG: hypothetical protein HFJ47_02870 [Clostridia bacterium]|nr:hypothetical protein [Clostridia bacterium]